MTSSVSAKRTRLNTTPPGNNPLSRPANRAVRKKDGKDKRTELHQAPFGLDLDAVQQIKQVKEARQSEKAKGDQRFIVPIAPVVKVPEIKRFVVNTDSFKLLRPEIIELKKTISVNAERIMKEAGFNKFTDIINPYTDSDIPKESLEPTKYCNFEKQLEKQLENQSIDVKKTRVDLQNADKKAARYVSQLASLIISQAQAHTINKKIEMLFAYVQELDYTLSNYNKTAADTLVEGEGTCSNKAIALIAMLRSQGIPALPIIYRVKSPHYLGEGTLFPSMSHWINQESSHVAVMVHNEERWIPIDPSDNMALCLGARIKTAIPIFFDSKNPKETLLYIEKKNVISATVATKIDHYLTKQDCYTEEVPAHILMISTYVEYAILQNGYSEEINNYIPKEYNRRLAHFFEWLRYKGNNGSKLNYQTRLDLYKKYKEFTIDAVFKKNVQSTWSRVEGLQDEVSKIEGDPRYFDQRIFKFLDKTREQYGDLFRKLRQPVKKEEPVKKEDLPSKL